MERVKTTTNKNASSLATLTSSSTTTTTATSTSSSHVVQQKKIEKLNNPTGYRKIRRFQTIENIHYRIAFIVAKTKQKKTDK